MTALLTVLVGFPASGKSHYRAELLASNPNSIVVSSDDYIDMKASEAGITYSEAFPIWAAEAQKVAYSTASDAFASGKDVIWDQTNLTIAKRQKITDMAPSTYTKTCVYISCPRDVRNMRMAERIGKNIPDKVIDQMERHFEHPDPIEGFDYITAFESL